MSGEDHFHSPPSDDEDEEGVEVERTNGVEDIVRPQRGQDDGTVRRPQRGQEDDTVRPPQPGVRGDSIRPPQRGQEDDEPSRRPEVGTARSLATPTRVVSGTAATVLQHLPLASINENIIEDNNRTGAEDTVGNLPSATRGSIPSRGSVTGPVYMPTRLSSTAPAAPTRISSGVRPPRPPPPSALRSQSVIRTTSRGVGGNGPPLTGTSFRSRASGALKATSSFRRGTTPSTIQGKKTVRLSVLPVAENHSVNHGFDDNFDDSIDGARSNILASARATSFAPKRLLDIENGTSIVVTDQKFLNEARYAELGKDGAIVVTARATAPIAREDALFFEERKRALQDKINAGDVHDLSSINEVDVLGGAWRGVLRRLMVMSYDEITGLRMGRQLQLFLPFQTGYESYVIAQLIEALDGGVKSEVMFILKIAFQNRNVSRIIVQNLGPRWDFLWHWHGQVTWNRLYDGWGQFPIVGITAFPATENFPATRDHALASMFRYFLGPGNWITRLFTQGREGLVTDNPNNTAQNLAAESNGFELANRNQYGTYVGRRKTNEFRFAHRLPTDESIVRTFIAQPMPTMINNGVVHTLRQLANHWHNMLNQFSGNFAHQRMEQLDPFETMRFHIPVVLVVLSSLRGRNKWDAQVLGPFIRKCQELKPGMNADACRYLVTDMMDNIVVNVCAGVASVVDPLVSWLEAIKLSCDGIEAEAKEVYEDVSSVEIGIRLGNDLITKVNWSLPSDKVLKNAILNHIRGAAPVPEISAYQVQNAMNLTTPRDKRTLIELVNNKLTSTAPAQLLLGRVKTLLQRELRRAKLNQALRELSTGDEVTETPIHDEWYWIEEGDKRGVYIYDAKTTGQNLHRFIHADSGLERFVPLDDTMTVRMYVPVAEAITRAQRCFMNIELDHGHKYKYNAFMEFNFLRMALRRLIVVSQICCEELDNARVNVLREVQRSNQVQVSIHDLEVGKTYYTYNGKTKEYEPFECEKDYTPSDPEWSELARARIVKIPPQSIIVIGGGPTGLMTVIHCTESCLTSGGIMKLYEARDAFAKGGATFERAQIVRLDARWIAMLRYHLGTGFEDVYIPASGETDSQLGNTLPTQGFVEITIKDLENMLHVEVSRLWSKGVIQCYTESKAKYDLVSNSLVKQGEALKEEDLILRRVDPNGNRTNKQYTWKVRELIKILPLSLNDLHIGQEYGVYIRLENAVIPFKLTGVDLESKTYTFKSLREGIENVKAHAENLPSVYPKGTMRHGETSKLLVESVVKGDSGGYVQEELAMRLVRKEKFTMDIGHTHVVECIGKPHGSNVHFSTTTYEPYGVCCIQGLKVSMGMHNFGNKRWDQGIVDDIRSHTDQNTRIVGDFTKMVRQAPIAKLMHEYMKSANWKTHFEKLVEDSAFPELTSLDPIIPKLEVATKVHADAAPGFRRQTLQTRFFETGDNYYLGMEFTREYDRWKQKTVDELVLPLSMRTNRGDDYKKKLGRFKGLLNHHIDRLWYDACLETIRQGDVYNPGAKSRVPRLYLINSYFDTKLGKLPVGESFRISDRPEEKYEVVIKKATQIIVRNVEGYISFMKRNTVVKLEGNLTRGPDGNAESKVALATFPVGHYVNHRTLRLSNEVKGYVFAFIGDEQSTPHFMRYSGLTGACINSMLFNNFVKGAVNGIPFMDRFALYSKETNWSNGEVVKRGTGANYGLDGFLRPGFPYDHGLDYLHSKVIEWMETQQDLDNILTPDWLNRFAAALVPRGMELNNDFIRCLRQKNQNHIFDKFMKEIKADRLIHNDDLDEALMMRKESMESDREGMDYEQYWKKFLNGIKGLDDVTKMRLQNYHIEIAKRLEQLIEQIIEQAYEEYMYSKRISSELFNQPKPVDSIVDDFAVEAQNFANSLTMSAAFSSGALAFTLIVISDTGSSTPNMDGKTIGGIFAAIIGALNIILSFGTMTNVSRYKIRNEEARVIFFEEKFLNVKKAVFSVMDRKDQDATPDNGNPFVIDLDSRMETFLKNAEYYDLEDPKELKEAYAALKANINDPEAIRAFQQKLSNHFIPDVYHVSSYLQEYLVNIFKVLEDMHYLLTQEVEKSSSGNAGKFFTRLTLFTPRLKNSLQDGHVRLGFLKKRSIFNWDCAVVFKYFYSLICCARSGGKTPLAPIQTETLGLVRQARLLSKQNGHTILRREIRDLEHLYWATRESDIASLIFVSGFLVFIASIVFTISRIITSAGGPERVTDVAFWATVASATGAILATFHFVRKLGLLIGLWFTLFRKGRQAQSMDDRSNIRKVRGVTFTQILLTLVRLGSATASALALPWSVAQFGFNEDIDLAESIPFWIALGALSSAVLATIFFFIVEYVVRYHLSPRLGEYICEAFRDEIENMYRVLEVPLNDVDTKQDQERETWEYVAREFLHRYRFDTVFAADRFGSILQYIQSGMDPRS